MTCEADLKEVEADSVEEWMQEVTLVLARHIDALQRELYTLYRTTEALRTPSTPATTMPWEKSTTWVPTPRYTVPIPVYCMDDSVVNPLPPKYWG